MPTWVNSVLLNSIQFHRSQRTAMSTSVPLNQSPDISDPLYQPADLPLSLSLYLLIYPSTNHTHRQCAHPMSSSHYNCCSNNKDRTGLPMHICTFLYSGCLLQPVPAWPDSPVTPGLRSRSRNKMMDGANRARRLRWNQKRPRGQTCVCWTQTW